jgi:hypothetical protein
MMAKANCWEFKKCGRQPGGAKASELGICAAATVTQANGLNGGKNGGRVCWAIAGTLCGGQIQGSYATKLTNCMQCDFHKLAIQEEGKNRIDTATVLNKLKGQ